MDIKNRRKQAYKSIKEIIQTLLYRPTCTDVGLKLQDLDLHPQIYQMISRSLWLGNHAIHIDFNLLMHHIIEQGYHGSLVGCIGIRQSKWHDIVGIGPLISGECCLGFILFSHFGQIITWEPIHKGEEHIGCGVINQGIDMWQGKIILWAGPIQISIINAHAYLPILLWHGNNVCNPIRLGYEDKKNGVQLHFYFFFDFQDSLRFHHSESLPHWAAIEFNQNPVDNNLYIQS